MIKRISRKLGLLFYSLRTQLIVCFMAISLVILAVSFYFAYNYFMDILKKNNEKYLLSQFSQADYNIRTIFDEVNRLSRLFLLDPSVQLYLEDNRYPSQLQMIATQNELFARMDQFIANYSYLDSIYVFTDAGAALGRSKKFTQVIKEDEPYDNFLTPEISGTISAAFPKPVIVGSFTTDFYGIQKGITQQPLISVARWVKPLSRSTKGAILVFNIDEKSIAPVYTGTDNLGASTMYIVLQDGQIVSSSSGENIGNLYGDYAKIDQQKDYGSFFVRNNGVPTQVVYYRLHESEWYLIGEIPVQIANGDAPLLRRALIIVFIVAVIAAFVASFFTLKSITRPLHGIADKMRDVGKGNLGLTFPRVPQNEFGILVRQFNEMSLSIKGLIEKNDRIQEEKRRLEIEALQHQINPHFLYNTLNMVKWMAVNIGAKNIVNCIVALGGILQRLFAANDSLCTLEEELTFLENYIKIINWRFDNNVHFSLDVDARYLQTRLPRFTLQPIIENAIKYGIQDDKESVSVCVWADNTGDVTRITVADTGTGIEQSRLDMLNKSLEEHPSEAAGEGVGLQNVNRRIKLSFGETFGISITSTPNSGTAVSVKLPTCR